MGRYVLRRLSISLPLLLVISIIAFTFINLAPGSPIDAMIIQRSGSLRRRNRICAKRSG